MLKRIYTFLYHFTWYAFAFIVLTAAVLVTVVRLALPEIGGYKNEMQSWVSEYMDYPVVIEEIKAEWQGWVPHLYLKNIDLFTPNGKTLISKFDSAHLGIDPIASLNKRELVPSQLSISGLNLEFTRNTNGSISIDNTSNLNTDSNSSALSEWLLKQKHITLEKAKLTWHDIKENKERQEFSNVRLELRTQQERIQIEALIPLPEEHGQSLTLKMDVNGNILTPDWKGSIYAEAKEVIPTHLLNGLPIESIGGSANAKLWTNWDNAKLIDVSGEINYSNFSLSTDEHNLTISNVGLSIHAERKQEKNWLLNVNIEHLQTENGLWPKSNYQLFAERNDSENNYRYSGFLSYLKLEEIIPFIVASNVISDVILEKLDWQSLKGELSNTSFSLESESNADEFNLFNTDFKNIEIVSNDKKNAVYGLKGSLKANNNSAKINLDSQFLEVSLGSILDKSLLLNNLNAKVELVNNDSLELRIKEFHIEDKFISAKSSGKIEFYEEASPFIDVVVHLDETSIEHLPNYLPKQTSENLKKWFEQALIAGQLLSGDLIFHGHANDFPFNNAEGNFKAILNVENATFSYVPGWPPIDKLSAEVIVDNDDLFVSSNSGYVFDAKIDHFKSNIINLGQNNPHVIVNGTIEGHTNDAGNFITQSPLNETPSLSKLTENVSGRINLKLNLDIPIYTEDSIVDGVVIFSDTTLESNLPGLSLEDVNGEVNFTAEEVWADGVDALYHGKSVKFTIPRFDQEKSETYVISGMADKEFIISQLTSFFPSLHSLSRDIDKNFSGESKWFLTLKKLISNGDKENRKIEFDSNLQGIAINLPYPLGKLAEEIAPLNIETTLVGLLIDEININYNAKLFSDFIVDNRKDFIVKKILVGLGQQHSTTSSIADISIQGELEELNVSEWIDFINPEKSTSTQNSKPHEQKKIDGDLYVKRLNILGNEFDNVNINVSNPSADWKFLFDSEEIKGQANFISGDKNKLHADFEKLTFKKHENQSDDNSQIAIEKIPELKVNVDNFVYNDNQLGQLNLLTNNIINGININNLSIEKPGFNITAKGEWLRIDYVDRSDFHATLEADSIETMLSTFNFNSANIKDGKTSIEMNAYWVDTPMNFSLEKIDGVLDMKIEKGHFLDINPAAGRLFGLLSIQTLPRRLSLDFSDLFDEGFAFDNIEGNFSLQQGHAYTNNLEMTGPSADIFVSGRTGLSTEDYDQIATVTPKISSGLPVASALFGPVGVGVGAVIYIAGEIFQSIPKKIDQILKAQYTITGSWDNPNIEKIEKEKEKESG